MSHWLPETEDFGLAPGEAFEPDLPAEPPCDLTRPHIITVLGPIAPEALGVVLPHEYLIAALLSGERFDDEHLTLAELEDYYVTGGRAIVDATPSAWGRDPFVIRWIAERSPVAIVAATGAGGPTNGRAEDLARGWIGEIEGGIADTGVKPGLIVVEAGAAKPALRAAAMAQLETGVPIMTTEAPPLVRRVMRQEEVAPDRVIVVIAADELDQTAVDHALGHGFWVMVDRIGHGAAGLAGLAEQAEQVQRLREAGFSAQLLCSLHLTRRVERRSGGGEGWGMILNRWPLALVETGVKSDEVRQLLVENPAQALAVRR